MSKQTKRQQEYLNKYAPRIYSRDKTTPTYAQYLQKAYNETPRTRDVRRDVKKASGFDWEKDRPSQRLRKK